MSLPVVLNAQMDTLRSAQKSVAGMSELAVGLNVELNRMKYKCFTKLNILEEALKDMAAKLEQERKIHGKVVSQLEKENNTCKERLLDALLNADDLTKKVLLLEQALAASEKQVEALKAMYKVSPSQEQTAATPLVSPEEKDACSSASLSTSSTLQSNHRQEHCKEQGTPEKLCSVATAGKDDEDLLPKPLVRKASSSHPAAFIGIDDCQQSKSSDEIDPDEVVDPSPPLSTPPQQPGSGQPLQSPPQQPGSGQSLQSLGIRSIAATNNSNVVNALDEFDPDLYAADGNGKVLIDVHLRLNHNNEGLDREVIKEMRKEAGQRVSEWLEEAVDLSRVQRNLEQKEARLHSRMKSRFQ